MPPWCAILPVPCDRTCVRTLLMTPLSMWLDRLPHLCPELATTLLNRPLASWAMTGPIRVALSILPARFRNRGLVMCVAIMVMSLVRTLLCLIPTVELPTPIPSPWVPLLIVP